MENFIALLVGVGLSATCGFRVFVPLLGLGIAAHSGVIPVSSGFAWIGTWPAMLAFGVATLCEIAGYYIPLFDNILDFITTPAALIAGTIATASVIGDISPFMKWSLAVIAGGGSAGLVQGGSVMLRGLSTATTVGIGNSTVSTGELVASVIGTILSILLPILAMILIIALVVIVFRWIFKEKKKSTPQPSS